MEIKKIFVLAFAILFLLPSCKKEKSAETEAAAFISIRFHPTFNNSPLQLNTPYTNAYGEAFTISTLKYYTGQYNLSDLAQGSGSNASGEPYFLADFADPATLSFTNSIKPV